MTKTNERARYDALVDILTAAARAATVKTSEEVAYLESLCDIWLQRYAGREPEAPSALDRMLQVLGLTEDDACRILARATTP